MAVSSPDVPLQTSAPQFSLRDLAGNIRQLGDFTAPVLVVAFLCNHCPYVRHIENLLGSVVARADVDVVAICSNDAVAYPDDGPEGLADQVRRAGWGFPYLIDDTQQVAGAFGAVCTPDFFVYDADRRLAYRGAFDASTPGNGHPLTGHDLSAALDAVAAGAPVPLPHRPSLGCGIKWLPDRQPKERHP